MFFKTVRFLSILFSISISGISFAQLTENSKVSLITIGPGDELYSAFGHSALLIYDPLARIDKVYNYGTFSDFSPDFYRKFTMGQMDYMLSIGNMSDEYYYWTTYENRHLTQQVLNLSVKQKNDLYVFLEKNALPENRVYRYDYFYDNCSTRIRDALQKVLRDSLNFNLPVKQGKSVRNLTDEYLSGREWGDLGIDVGLGLSMDKKLTPFQYMFIPDYLMWDLDKAVIYSNGSFKPIVSQKRELFVPRVVEDKSFFPTPNLAFSFLLILAIIFSIPKLNKTFFSKIFDFLLFLTTGLVGCLLVFLWFFTAHQSQYNFNILWAFPLNLIASFVVFNAKWVKAWHWYFVGYGILAVIVALFGSFLPQHLNVSCHIIGAVLAIRSVRLAWQKAA